MSDDVQTASSQPDGAAQRGIVIGGGLNPAMEYTNRTEFCTSCHEMTIPPEELKETVH